MKRLFSSLTDYLKKANVNIPDFKVCGKYCLIILVLGNGRNSNYFLSKWMKYSFDNKNIQEIKYGNNSLENKFPVDFLESGSLVHIPSKN